MKLSRKHGRIAFGVGIVALLALGYMLWTMGEESTDDATIEAHVVTLSPKVSGYVKEVDALDNQPVKAGDVLLEIDPSDYIIRRDHARASLEAAKAAYESSNHTFETTEISAPSGLDAARAQVAAASANWDKARNDLKRMQRLSDQARSREQLDEAVAAEKTSFSNLQDAKARLRTAQTAPKTIASAKYNADQLAAQVKQAQADLDQAEKDLADTRIVAPMDGRMTKRSAEIGDYVQTGQQLGYLVGNELWVIANFKETQLKHMQSGQSVSIRIDAFPSVKLDATVDSIQSGTGVRFSSFPPENATGNFVKIVQRVPVKIFFRQPPASTLPLGPGMSVVPTVYTR